MILIKWPFVSNQKVNQGLKKIALFAGIDKTVTYHLARHSYGHVLGGNNVSGFAIQTLMGHSKPSMTSRYVNFSPDSLRSAIQGVSFLSSWLKNTEGLRLCKERILSKV